MLTKGLQLFYSQCGKWSLFFQFKHKSCQDLVNPMNKRSKYKIQIAADPHDKSHQFSPTPRLAVPQQGPANRTTTTWNEAEYVSRQTQEIDLSQFQ